MKSAWTAGLLAITGWAFGLQVSQDRPDTVIRTTTRLVQVRVMAEDSKGSPVIDLRKEELQLQDNRRPQTIFSFAAEGSTPPGAANHQDSAAAPAEQAHDDFAMILLDWRNPRYTSRLRGFDNVTQLLHKFQPRQQLAVYVFEKESSYLLHDFTSDRADLLRALESVKDVPYEPDDGPVGKFDARYNAARASTAKLSVEEQIFAFNSKILDSFDTLGKVADGLARVAGRKSLIWVSNGFPIVLDGHAVPGAKSPEVDYGQELERVIAKFNRANVAVYAVDARGLPLGEYGDLGTLKEFAARTGGTAFYDRNDLDEGMRLALEDTKVSYTLGFVVPIDAAPGLHQILLRTTRRGVTLRYRESYQLDDTAVTSGPRHGK